MSNTPEPWGWPLPFSSAERTLRTAIRNCAVPANPRQRRGVTTRRYAVSVITGHGSTYSIQLCRWAGLDPEQRVVLTGRR